MTASTTPAAAETGPRTLVEGLPSVLPAPGQRAACWSAILAGAGAIASLNLLLMLLGTGLGLSSISPWAREGASAAAIGFAAIVWYAFTQLGSSVFGGYLAGRLRTRWIVTPADEVHFRDTAHGFLAWAVSFVVSLGFLAGASVAVLHGGMQAGAGAASAVAAGAAAKTQDGPLSDFTGNTTAYFLDVLMRPDASSDPAQPSPAPYAPPGPGGQPGTLQAPGTGLGPERTTSSTEVGRIFLNGLRSGMLTPEDIRQAGRLVADRTGLSRPDAEKRVSETFTRLKTRLHDAELAARDAADKARKAAAYVSLWGFASLLLGAFGASLSATWGGRQRDAKAHAHALPPKEPDMRSILLYLLGVPIPIIILIALLSR